MTVDPAVQSQALTKRVEPTYPPEARAAKIQGTVRLEVLIDTSGAVKSVREISGRPLLIPAAVAAVKQWRYKRTVVNGIAKEVTSTVDVEFRLP